MRDQSYIEWANSISQKIIEAGMDVHKTLGPGLLESIYENSLALELGLREIRFERQIPVPVFYKKMLAGRSLRLDLIVEDAVIVELKTVDRIIPIHEAQLISYLRLTGISVGLILNFNTALFRDGIKRMVFNFDRRIAGEEGSVVSRDPLFLSHSSSGPPGLWGSLSRIKGY